MKEKRRDSKGRVLRNGEVQRPDGKYMYRYMDESGIRRSIYSWKLVETDKAPSGVKPGPALRTLIKSIEHDIDDGIRSYDASQYTLNNLFDYFMGIRTDLSENTRCNYLSLYNKHVRNAIGTRTVDTLKYTDIQRFYFNLSKDKGLKINTIRVLNAVIWQALQIAVKDNIIRRNPAEGVLCEVGKKLKEKPQHRGALTVEQQRRFIDYIYNSKRFNRYGALFTVLLGTGMRISECLGLRWCDVDFKENLIHVNHTLNYRSLEAGKYEFRIGDTKTFSGNRDIPMFEDVRKAFIAEKQRWDDKNFEPFTVNGYTGFIFLNQKGKAYSAQWIFDLTQAIVDDYNKEEALRAKKEGQEPCFIPKISPHTLRHTFCTRLCEVEHNIKVVQDVMGHKNISTTMDIYNEATVDLKIDSFKNIDGAIYLG